MIHGLEKDIQTAGSHPLPQEGFVGAEIFEREYTEKELAGETILSACQSYTGTKPVELGVYRGFTMELSFNSRYKEYEIALKGAMTHVVALGTDARGNFTRMDNALGNLEVQKKNVQIQLKNLENQQKAAKAELDKPFPQEAELREKSARLAELDAALNLDEHSLDGEKLPESDRKPSVLNDLKSKTAISGTVLKTHPRRAEAR